MDGSRRGRWTRRNKSLGGERADRERSEHATAAASRRASIHPRVFRISDAVWPLRAHSLLSATAHHHVQRPAPSHRRPPLKRGPSRRSKNSTLRERARKGIGERCRNQTPLRRLFISSRFSRIGDGGRRKQPGQIWEGYIYYWLSFFNRSGGR